MPKLKWALACKDVRSVRSLVHIIGEFDKATFKNYPSPALLLNIVSRWEGEPDEKFSFRVNILDPSLGNFLKSKERNVILEQGGAFVRVAFELVVFPKSGEYTIELIVDNKAFHAFTLQLR